MGEHPEQAVQEDAEAEQGDGEEDDRDETEQDLHDLARGRGSLDEALARITAPTLVMGISSDILYPSYQQRALCADLEAAGTHVVLDDLRDFPAWLDDHLAGTAERVPSSLG